MFHCSVINVLRCLSDSFCILSCCFCFVKNFFNFFSKKFFSSFSPQATLIFFHDVLSLSRTFFIFFWLFSQVLPDDVPDALSDTTLTEYHLFSVLSTPNFVVFRKLFFDSVIVLRLVRRSLVIITSLFSFVNNFCDFFIYFAFCVFYDYFGAFLWLFLPYGMLICNSPKRTDSYAIPKAGRSSSTKC